mgnify:CR=1 FL=1
MLGSERTLFQADGRYVPQALELRRQVRMRSAELGYYIGYGKNKMEYDIENTLNRSIGPSSKRTFYAGGYAYDQLVFNLTGVRSLEVAGFASPLNIAVGTEARCGVGRIEQVLGEDGDFLRAPAAAVEILRLRRRRHQNSSFSPGFAANTLIDVLPSALIISSGVPRLNGLVL